MRKWMLLLLMIPVISYALPPLDIQIQYECPEINFDPHDPDEPLLANNGQTIIGGGDVQVNSRRMEPYHADYTGISEGSNIPLNLQTGGYVRSGAFYFSVPGIIKCHYRSTMGFDGFDVFHLINNGQGGTVATISPAFIIVKFAIG